MKKTRKKILITGGAGYIGLNLIIFFLKENHQITAIDNFSTSKPINPKLKKYINFFRLNLERQNQVKNFFKKKKF